MQKMSERERLIFQPKSNLDKKDIKVTTKAVNPLSLLQKQPKVDDNHPSQQFINSQGRFVDGILLGQKQTDKTKLIKKPPKIKNYKTKMCPYGRDCLRKITCTFAHNEYELRKRWIKRTKVCILYQQGQCQLGALCRDYHGNMDLKKKYKYKEEVCKDFLEGKCGKGEICIYIHEKPKEILEENDEVEQPQIVEKDINQDNNKNLGNQTIVEQKKTNIKVKPLQTISQKLEENEKILQDGLCFNFNFGNP